MIVQADNECRFQGDGERAGSTWAYSNDRHDMTACGELSITTYSLTGNVPTVNGPQACQYKLPIAFCELNFGSLPASSKTCQTCAGNPRLLPRIYSPRQACAQRHFRTSRPRRKGRRRPCRLPRRSECRHYRYRHAQAFRASSRLEPRSQ